MGDDETTHPPTITKELSIRAFGMKIIARIDVFQDSALHYTHSDITINERKTTPCNPYIYSKTTKTSSKHTFRIKKIIIIIKHAETWKTKKEESYT